jgi:exosortase
VIRFSVNRLLALAGTLAMLVAYYSVVLWRPIVETEEGAVVGFLFEPASTSPQLIFLLVVFFLWGRRSRLLAALGAPANSVIGGAAFVGGATIFLWSIYTASPDLQILSLIPTLLGIGLLLGGRELVAAILLPTLLIPFAVPLPAIFVNQIIFPMQIWTSILTEGWLGVIGIDYVRQGDVLFVGQNAFQVIETCSGLRSVETLLMATVVYMELFHVRGVRAVLLFLAAPAIAFFLNGLRVLSIVLTIEYDSAADHTIQGIVTLVVGVVAVHGLDGLLARFFPDRPVTYPVPTETGLLRTETPAFRWRALAIVALLTLMAVAPFWIDPWRPASHGPRWGVSLPRQWDTYASKALKPDEQFLGSVRFKPLITRAYENGTDRIEIFLGYDALLSRHHHPVSPKIAISGTGWEVLTRGPVPVEGVSQPVEMLLARSRGRTELTYSWYVGTRSALQEAIHALLALDRSEARNTTGITAVRISTPLRSEPDALAAAHARLLGFAQKLYQMVGDAHTKLESGS